ncbi:hypothetical protein ACOT81_26240 [Streptomyces sp. WI04-05B]|uniref:hypothetical protein n=1 Tax=Streptomyces TaxID=1883 RepID=UPI0029A50822|nr:MULTISPECIES: hypothetical protein [unclassified Streptomyces]MDX2545267.1 hypothetical protein [Streptomyces sp. WI04-05B]MDX2587381.1 hypothetical protein [Streptomyces sp. WI04-05A]
MRIRATVAAVTGALALSAFAVPAAQAATAPDVTFTKVTINNGKPIVARAAGTTSVPVTYTFKHAAGLDIGSDNLLTGPALYVGAALTEDNVRLIGDEPGTCTATSTTTASCKGFIDLHASGDEKNLGNTDARTWKVGAVAITTSDDGGIKIQSGLGTTQVKFHSKLTTDATPEPVRKNATITVKGTLTRANWNTNKYGGYVNAPVTLQFKKKGATTFTTVKTVKAGAAGALKTTVKATVDGTYRYAFAGSSTTAPINAVGDVIDVK